MEPRDTAPSHAGGRPKDPLIGHVLEHRYRILGELGEGGVGVVYRAEHLKLDRTVALKVLQKEYGGHPTLRLRFEREAKVLAQLSHPNIVTITDYGIADNMPYLVMELLEGVPLAEEVAKGPMDTARALDIATQILRALAYAHGQGLIHRDLKPGNIFLQSLPDAPHHVRVLDFGLAKFLVSDQKSNQGPNLTRTGVVFGTPSYMAPEQATGAETDARSDVYALGVILFEMLAGMRPFTGTRSDVLRQHLLNEAPALEERCPGRVPSPALATLLKRSMAKERSARYADASEMLEALEALPRPALVKDECAGNAARVTGAAPDPAAAAETAREGDLATAPTAHAMPAVEAPRMASKGGSTAGASRRPPNLLLLLPLGLGLLVLVGFGIGISVYLVGGHEAPLPPAETHTEEPLAPPPPLAGADESPADEALPPDPWAENVPPDLGRYRERVLASRTLHSAFDKALRRLARKYADDPRPLLLLAHVYIVRGWRPDGLETYERALERDPAARGDPTMLADLIGLVPHDKLGTKAARMVERIYGKAACDALEEALNRENDRSAQRRLSTLLTRLSKALPR